MEYERCYTYEAVDEPPSKKRRLEASGLHKSWPDRRKLFDQTWQELDGKFSEAIASLNAPNVEDINNFLRTAHEQDQTAKIPTGIVLLEPGSSSRSRSVAEDLSLDDIRIITLESSAAPNLKTALKSICGAAIRDASTKVDIETVDDADDDEAEITATKSKTLRKANGRRLLAYDLEILQVYASQSDITSFVIHLEDTEGFSGEVLSELIEHLSFWRDRLSIVLLMNVSTSIDMLERRLSRTARSVVSTRLFPAATCEEEFEELLQVLMKHDSEGGHVNTAREVRLGPSIIRLAAQRQGDYLQDIALIKNGLKYALMCAFYANPLLDLLMPQEDRNISSEHCQALRNLPSFRKLVRTLLDEGSSHARVLARRLLTNDDFLLESALDDIWAGVHAVKEAFGTVRMIWRIQQHIPTSRKIPLATLYIQGLSGTLQSSVGLRGLFLALRKAPLANFGKVLDALDSDCDNLWKEQCDLELEKLRELIDMDIPDESQGHPTLRGMTTDATRARKDTYAEVINRVSNAIEQAVHSGLPNRTDLAFHEVIIWDQTSPYREVFMPRSRQALERALETPHDYLDCDCCNPEEIQEGDTSTTQPATAILYDLYKESGNLINAHDLWQAFRSVIGEDKDDEQTMAMFQRSLAELKHLGMVKGTRKRIDHIAKVAWPGL